jgi:DNA-binding NtrC family response regulator
MAKPRILVVDDDAAMQEALPTFLKIILDCDVTVKSNGSDAIAVLDKEDFNLIIQDLQMPGIDGFTVLAHAIKKNPKIIRIVLTGMIDPAITKKVEGMGAVYVSKPPELKVLELIVKRELQKTCC